MAATGAPLRPAAESVRALDRVSEACRSSIGTVSGIASPRSPIAPFLREIRRAEANSGFITARTLFKQSTGPEPIGSSGELTEPSPAGAAGGGAAANDSQEEDDPQVDRHARWLAARAPANPNYAEEIDKTKHVDLKGVQVFSDVSSDKYGLPILKSDDFLLPRRSKGLAPASNAMRLAFGAQLQAVMRLTKRVPTEWSFYGDKWTPCESSLQSMIQDVILSKGEVPPFVAWRRAESRYVLACVPFFAVEQFKRVADSCPESDSNDLGSCVYFIQVNTVSGMKRPIRVRFVSVGIPDEMRRLVEAVRRTMLKCKGMQPRDQIQSEPSAAGAPKAATSPKERAIVKFAGEVASVRVAAQAATYKTAQRFTGEPLYGMKIAVLTHDSMTVDDSYLAMPRSVARLDWGGDPALAACCLCPRKLDLEHFTVASDDDMPFLVISGEDGSMGSVLSPADQARLIDRAV